MRPNSTTYRNQIQIWLVSALIMLIGIGLAILFSTKSNPSGYLLTLLPVILGFIAILFINPYFGFIVYINYLFFYAGFGRYFPDIPASLIGDTILIFTLVSLVLRHNKVVWTNLKSSLFLLCLLWFFYNILYAGIVSNSLSEMNFKLHGFSFYAILIVPVSLLVINSKENLNKFLKIILFWTIISIIWAACQYANAMDQIWKNEIPFTSEMNSVYSIFSNSLVFGNFLAFIGVICLLLSFSNYRAGIRIAYSILFVFCFSGICLSGKLLPFLILFSGLLMFLVLRNKFILSLFSVLTFVLLSCFLLFTDVGNQNYQFRKLRAEICFTGEFSNPQNIKLPGMETKTETLSLNKNESLSSSFFYEISKSNPSRIFNIRNEGGLPGILIYLAIMVFVFIVSFRKVSNLKSVDSRQKLTALFCGFSGLTIVGLISPAVWQFPIMVLYLIVITVLISAERFDENASLRHLKTSQG